MSHQMIGPGIVRFGAIVAFGTSLMMAGGCRNCTSKGKEMTENAQSLLDFSRKCCLEISVPDQRDECLRKVNETSNQIAGLIVNWTIACEDDNSQLMKEVTDAIRERLRNQSCENPDAPIAMSGSSYASIASPLSTVERIDMEISGRVGGSGALLAGPTCIVEGDASLCTETEVKIGWLSRFDESGRGPSGSAVLTTFQIRFPDLANASLTMIPFEGNAIEFDRRGAGSIKALMRFSEGATTGLFDTAWFEFPIQRVGDQLLFGRAGMTGLDIAPQIPNAVADWNGDFTVDAADMAAFYEDFADGPFDLDGDGEISNGDIAYFESVFYEHFEG